MEPEFHLISLLFYPALLLEQYLSSEQAQFTHCRRAKRRGVDRCWRGRWELHAFARPV